MIPVTWGSEQKTSANAAAICQYSILLVLVIAGLVVPPHAASSAGCLADLP